LVERPLAPIAAASKSSSISMFVRINLPIPDVYHFHV
jgi:hypothetical protein